MGVAYESDVWASGFRFADADDERWGVREGDVVSASPSAPLTVFVAYCQGAIIATGSRYDVSRPVREARRLHGDDPSIVVDEVPADLFDEYRFLAAPALGELAVDHALAWGDEPVSAVLGVAELGEYEGDLVVAALGESPRRMARRVELLVSSWA